MASSPSRTSASPLAGASTDQPLLVVEDLTIEFRTGGTWAAVVDGVSFTVDAGHTLGLVGESGSGKTVTSLGVMGLIPALRGRVARGAISFDRQELTALDERQWRDLRGNQISMIFQQPARSLNPAFTVGEQIAEVVRRHRGVSRKAAWRRAVEMLDRVHIPNAARRAREYPHTFSGGMSQRVMIAMALACEPRLLIADEPTTALDVTVQAVILDLLRELQDETDVAIIFITHDLGVVAEMCDVIAVMYAGQIVETAPVDDLLRRPQHPYTEGLLASIPRVGEGRRIGAIPGVVPPPHRMPAGCRFHPRCSYSIAGRCDSVPVPLAPLDDHRAARCVRVQELELRGVEDTA